MKTLTVAELTALISNGDWDFDTRLDIIDEYRFDVVESFQNDFSPMTCGNGAQEQFADIKQQFAIAGKRATQGDLAIVCEEGAEYVEYEPDTVDASTHGLDDTVTFEGFTAVDEDGDTINPEKALSLAFMQVDDDVEDAFTRIRYSDFLEAVEDLGQSSESAITLPRTGKPYLRFDGEKIAGVSSTTNPADGDDWSGVAGRWEQMALYRASNGKYVCHYASLTDFGNERPLYSAIACDTIDDVKGFFGNQSLADDLYLKVGIRSFTEEELEKIPGHAP